MKRQILTTVMSFTLLVLALPCMNVHAEEGQLGENIALKAVASAEHENTSAANVNNGSLATSDPFTSWNTWKSDGLLNYPTPVTLTWDKTYEISGMRVMWWADNANKAGSDSVTFPKSCEVYYLDNSDNWVLIDNMTDENQNLVSEVGVVYDASDGNGLNGKNKYWNCVTFAETVQTKGVRLVVDRNGTNRNGIGISEWEVFGEKVISKIGEGVNIAPNAKASADRENTPASNVNNGALATGNAQTSWNTWNNSGSYPTPVTLTWEEPYEISSMRVMWWADNATQNASGNVTFPKSCKAYYYDNTLEDWVEITDMQDENDVNTSSVGVRYDGNNGGINGANSYWNGVLLKTPVRTTQMRLYIDRSGMGSNGVGISEWEVYGEPIKDELFAAKIIGKERISLGETAEYQGFCIPSELPDVTYEWSVPEAYSEILEITGNDTDASKITVTAKAAGAGALKLKCTYGTTQREVSFPVSVESIQGIDDYITATAAGREPILPKMVVVNGISFDDPTPSLKSVNKTQNGGTEAFDFGEEFNSKLMPVEWEAVDPKLYAADQAGKTFTVNGIVNYGGEQWDAKAQITVKKPVVAPDANSAVTFENVKLNDEFWQPKQKVNALNSLNAGINRIAMEAGGEPNFDNAIKKLNGESYEPFHGFVFQDTDIYKSIEAISYTLSVIQDDKDTEIAAQREKLEDKLADWISKIEQVQYADGYINTHFTLRSTTFAGGSSPGTHRFRDFSNHEMYIAGHFFESVVAYTRYREGIGDPDYSLYVVGKRFADDIVRLFGPDGQRHEVPGHEEIELALIKLAKLAEEYEGEGAGQKYIDTAKLLIDRRGEDQSLRESNYKGGDYSQDKTPFTQEKNGVGHAVRATYLYAGATDIATLLPDGDADKEAYLDTLDTIWDSVQNRKTYITGGIGVRSHGEDFGGDYELPNDDSYCETCASIAVANWNQRMNLVHQDAKYVDVVEKALYNGILVGTNLEGNLFYYDSRLEVSNGNARSEWFACACCPPNLMRTIASLSGYMYSVHQNDVYVNMYIGSDAKVNVDGTKVVLKQETKYPWEGKTAITVTPESEKEFTVNIRIPGWIHDQKNKNTDISVNGENISTKAVNGYVAIKRKWMPGDVITVDMPMEIRLTEANPNVKTNSGRVAIERGPLVYSIEKAGNTSLNPEVQNLNPLNYVIPRSTEFTAQYNPELLKGVVEITGDVYYEAGGKLVPAKLQAIPFYAWNNRGDGGIYGQNNATKMLIWTKADGFAVSVHADKNTINIGDTAALTGIVAAPADVSDNTYQWSVTEGRSVEITDGDGSARATVKGIMAGESELTLTVSNSYGTQSATYSLKVNAP
ncbi:glycoside hydrolase family 127 protein, partial [Robinsoniella peoriensis]|uniref:glycoside hydrolase family 127 protein n=3 Tax=Robinsoniella TaxID=588605 RepID=UPI0010FB6614